MTKRYDNNTQTSTIYHFGLSLVRCTNNDKSFFFANMCIYVPIYYFEHLFKFCFLRNYEYIGLCTILKLRMTTTNIKIETYVVFAYCWVMFYIWLFPTQFILSIIPTLITNVFAFILYCLFCQFQWKYWRVSVYVSSIFNLWKRIAQQPLLNFIKNFVFGFYLN